MTPINVPVGFLFVACTTSGTWGLWERLPTKLLLWANHERVYLGKDVTTSLHPGWERAKIKVLSEDQDAAVRAIVALHKDPHEAIVMLLTMQGVVQ